MSGAISAAALLASDLSATRFGASPADWDHWADLGFMRDLLPIFSTPGFRFAPVSKMRTLGKTPSVLDKNGGVVGLPKWTARETTLRDLARWKADNRLGLCIQTREVRALDLDIGDEATVEAIKFAVWKATRLVLPCRSRANSAKCLLVFRCDGFLSKRTFRVNHGVGVVEFLGNGQQFVAAGAHWSTVPNEPSGARYEWEGGRPASIPEITREQFEALWKALYERFGIAGTMTGGADRERKRGQAFDAFDGVSEHLIVTGRVIDQGRDGQLFVECPWADEHTTDSGVTATAWFPAGTGGYAQGHFKCLHAHCAGRTDQDFRAAIGYELAQFEPLPPAVGAHAEHTAPGSDEWPDPLPLKAGLLPVPPFDLATLPDRLGPWVADIAERMNCPAEFVAIPAMVAAGGLIGRRAGIRPEAHGDWLEVGNLWGCVVAPPGALKSPAARAALAPLRALEAQAALDNAEALSRHRAEQMLAKLEREAVEKAARKAIADGTPAGRDEAMAALARLVEPAPPPERRFLTSDVTVEKLGELCAANPDGLMVHRDELLTLFGELEHPDKASARGFLLTGWGGLDGYTFDRVQRGTVRVPAVNLSLCGTAQPNRLAAHVRDSLKRSDDGMVQRLQLLAWPDAGAAFREVDRLPNAEAERAARDCYAGLAALDPRAIGATIGDAEAGARPVPFLRFDGAAHEHFAGWRCQLEAKVRDDDEAPAVRSHLAKYRGLIPRLALVVHLASAGAGPVTATAIRRAIAWADFLEAHARRAYASTTVDDTEAARGLWRRIEKGELPSPFTARDVRRRGWANLADAERVAGALAALVDVDWLKATTAQTGGRPTVTYVPNPKALRSRLA